MKNATASSVRSSDQVAAYAVLAGALFSIAGIIFSLLGFSGVGIVSRWAGILLFTLFALRKPSIMIWTFLAMLAGVELGFDMPRVAEQMRLPGDLFLRLIRMIVAPLLFATITTGIAGHSALRSVGRVTIKALIYFEVVTTLGLAIGSLAMNLVGAGWGVTLPATAETAVSAIQQPQNWQQFLLNIFPENIAQAVAQNQVLQVAVFSILFGIALALLPEQKKAPLLVLLQSIANAMFQLTRIVMYLAPVAAGSALAFTVGHMGLATLLSLGKLVATFYGTAAVFCIVVLTPILLLFRIPIPEFLRFVGEPAAIGFATSTSEAALPLAMERMEEFGVPTWIVSFVIPTGYSFNMIGSSLYVSMAVVFIAQVAGIHLNFGRQVEILAMLTLASKGVAGVPRAVLVVLLATASSIRLPVAPILLILGVDTLMDMGRTTMNIVGNCMASAIIARTEGTLRPAGTLRRA